LSRAGGRAAPLKLHPSFAEEEGMRLVLISDPDLPDLEADFRLAHRLCEELRRRALKVLHLTGAERGRPPLERLSGVPVRRLVLGLPGKRPLGEAYFELRARWALRGWLAEIRGREPKLIHAHLSPFAIRLGAQAARDLHVPWVVTAGGEAAERLQLCGGRAPPSARQLSTCAGAVAPSEEILRRLERWLPPAAVRAVIPAGVEARGTALPALPVVLGIGRLTRERGFDVLLRSFAAVKRAVPEALLVLAGEGPERRRLARLLKTLPHSVGASVRLEGGVNPERAIQLFEEARVVVFPNLGAGGERLAAEAMAAGRPVVVTGNTLLPLQPIDGGNSLVVEPDDAAGLAEAIAGLLEDRELSERIAHAGRGEVLRTCDWSECGSRYLELFRTVARPSPRAS
jgi:colanic acid/amylovoran biosynthesis glycosyltransferase